MRNIILNFKLIFSFYTVGLLVCMVFLLSGQALGADYYVDIDVGADMPAPANGTSSATPWKTMHYALNNISDGDTLHVGAGIYSIGTLEDDSPLQLNYNSVTIQGDPGGGSVLDGSGATSWWDGIMVSSLDNVTISNLEIQDFSGSGVNLYSTTNATVASCSIHDNAVSGIYMNDCGNTNAVKQNMIFDNPTGIYLFGDISECSPVIVNNLIYDGPVSTVMNNGIEIAGGSMGNAFPSIYHNTINGKSAGNGISLSQGGGTVSPDIKYNIVTNFANGIIVTSGTPSSVMDYNDFFGNSTHYDTGLPAPTNSISENPLYSDETNYNFSLQTASPCINAATISSVAEDLEGTVRPQGAAPDMGCYEYSSATPQTWYVDIDHPAAMDDLAYGFATSSPWKTLHYALTRMGSDDTLVVMSGTYSILNGESDLELLVPVALEGITIQGNDSQGSTPVIDGTGASGWTDGIQINADMVTIQGINVNWFVGLNKAGIQVAGSDVVIDGCRISDNTTGVHFTSGAQNNWVLGASQIDNNAGNGIFIEDNLNTVDNCWVHHNGGAGIYVQASSTAIQMGCQVDNNGDNAIVINGDNNTVDNCSIHDNTGNGILSQSGQILFIQGNCDIFNNTLDGILIGAMETYVDSSHVHENGRYGVFIDGTTYPWAINNSIRYGCEIFNNSDGGIFISNSSGNQIFSNTGTGAGIYDNGGQGGIAVDGSSSYGNNIYNNLIYNTGTGLYVQDVGITASAIGSGSGLSISENQIVGHPTNGISIANSDGSIKRNRIEDNGTGLFITTLTVTANPEVWNNLFFSATSLMNYGIHLYVDISGVVDNSLTIYHNTIDNAQTDGIFVERAWSTAEPSIFYNNITNYGSYGINNSGGNPAVGYNNVYAVGAPGQYNGCADSGGGLSSDPVYDSGSLTGYSLQSTSPSVNAISNATADPVPDDFDGTGRPQPVGGDFDMGCFEYVATGPDTDSDGIPDSVEDASSCLDSANPDSDGDGLIDGVEDSNYNGMVESWESDPCDTDTDNDGIDDGTEVANGSTSTNIDSDDDGFTDGEEDYHGTDPLNPSEYPVLTPGAYWVSPASDALGLGTSASPWNSLHRAISHINDGTPGAYMLNLAAGTCRVTAAGGHEPDDVLMIYQNDLTISGAGVGNTIIDGWLSASWIDGLDLQGVNNVVIQGISFRNFASASGIHMGGAQDCTVESCLFFDNNRGITIESGPLGDSASNKIQNNLFYDSSSIMDYGIYLITVTAEDFETEIYHNTINGGLNDGIYIESISTIPSPRIEFNIISNFGGYGINGIAVNPAIDFNNVWANTAGDYGVGTAGPASISVPPVYVDEAAGDFHLQSTSECIDAIPEPDPNDPPPHPVTEDLEGSSRPINGAYDMGCYETLPAPVPPQVQPTYYTVSFSAGPGGIISGSTSQRVLSGNDCSSVIAVPDSGYLFTGWEGGASGTANPLTIANVRSNMSINASFEPETVYTVTFTAGTGGSISGSALQNVLPGGDCSPVTAVADEGYVFMGWSGDASGMTNPLTITNVTSALNISAEFQVKAEEIVVAPGTGGDLAGDVEQDVDPVSNTLTLVAVPEEGYHFTGWSGDYTGTENPLVLSNIPPGMEIFANFEINTYPVSSDADPGGSVAGNSGQPLEHGSSITLMAIAEPGFEFNGWSGDAIGMTNPLTLENVISPVSVYANFKVNHPCAAPSLTGAAGTVLVAPGAVILAAGEFSDPENDTHKESHWQMRQAGDTDLFYDFVSSVDLETHSPASMLDSGVKYQWRVGYTDAGSRLTSWSPWEAFIVGESSKDENIPAVPPGFDIQDYRMMSFIQWPANYSFLNIVNSSTGADSVGEDVKIGTYNPLTGAYAQYPDIELEPGRAYWILARYGVKLDMQGVFVSTEHDYNLQLSYDENTGNGWNMIGIPNGAYYSWYDLEITEINDSGQTISGPMPISMLADGNEYIDRRIWRWDEGGYVSDNSDSFVMQPYEGGWVKSKKKNIILVFPVSSQSGLFAHTVFKGEVFMAGVFNRVSPAYAGTVSEDMPPMPMGLGSSGSSSDSGCFIRVMSNE